MADYPLLTHPVKGRLTLLWVINLIVKPLLVLRHFSIQIKSPTHLQIMCRSTAGLICIMPRASFQMFSALTSRMPGYCHTSLWVSHFKTSRAHCVVCPWFRHASISPEIWSRRSKSFTSQTLLMLSDSSANDQEGSGRTFSD